MNKEEVAATYLRRMTDPIEFRAVDPPNPIPTDLPYVTHVGSLAVGGHTLKAYVLSDGRRIFDAGDVDDFFNALGGFPR